MKINKIDAGKRIKQLRQSEGLTMQELGGKLKDSPRATVSNWERGTNLPNPQRLKMLAEIGNVTIDWIKWGTLKDYIYTYLCNHSSEYTLKNKIEISNLIYGEIEEKYSESYSLVSDYKMLDSIIESMFKEYRSREIISKKMRNTDNYFEIKNQELIRDLKNKEKYIQYLEKEIQKIKSRNKE